MPESPASSRVPSILPEWLYKPSTHTVPVWMKWSCAALVVFAILLVVTYYRAMGDIDTSLFGFWEVDSDFADEAHLDAMYMYISPPVVKRGGVPVADSTQSLGVSGSDLSIYMFLKADCAVRFNKTVKSRIARRNVRLDTIQKYTIDFETPVSIIPKSIVAEYDTVTQMLILRSHDSKQTYARMFKKPEISFYCTTETSRLHAVTSAKKSTANRKVSADVDDDEIFGNEDADADADGDEDTVYG